MFQNFRIHLMLEITYFGYSRIQTIVIVFVRILENDRVGSNRQLRKENPSGPFPLAVKVSESEEISINYYNEKGPEFFSSIWASDGHWPAESSGPLFFLQSLVTTCSSNPIAVYLSDFNINDPTP